ncbi:MAG: Hsp70 family protein [Myxococcaceae bacterium]|jgi:molecular chaperone DnaK (HSP70)|nr:Hsp70 family protein [Myxococcaceae bacterium]MCA3015000.1 Hsp70 family protein [Myxococcaceae bacterium]
MSASFCVGIDLGTTHSALSWIALDASEGRGPNQAVLPIAQVTAPGTVEERQLLPSFVYLPAEGEFPRDALALPWKGGGRGVVGEFARAHGTRVPTRQVASAKSWLCHPGVDRRAKILPWQAPDDVAKVSPVEASARVLEHLAQAWNRQFGKRAPLSEQQVVVTVPASFDAAAKDLTLEAAKQAGLEKVTLLEEPQAAVYAWLEAMGRGWRAHLKAGDVLLVVDVGGGTSDFSLVRVGEVGGELSLERLAVGDHILLGGDNMDLALAFSVNERFKAQGKALDAWQLSALTQACRVAKEQLLSSEALDKAPVTVPGRGSSLIGGTLKGELTRAELTSLLVDGFFPRCAVTDAPATARRSGLAQVGLPYAQDAGITRHLAAFLARQARSLQLTTGFAQPTAVLFNGGVFKAPALKARVLEVLSGWLAQVGAPAPKELPGADLDLAVARGAASYGWVKGGHGIRIRGGTARSYYVGVEAAMLAVPGYVPPVKALCVAPFGMEEGTQADVPPQEFGLVVGEATRFRFFSSSTRRADAVGTMVEDAERAADLEELVPIETTLSGDAPGQLVPINLQAAVTELGALEVRCLERGGEGRWKLELNVRERTP